MRHGESLAFSFRVHKLVGFVTLATAWYCLVVVVVLCPFRWRKGQFRSLVVRLLLVWFRGRFPKSVRECLRVFFPRSNIGKTGYEMDLDGLFWCKS